MEEAPAPLPSEVPAAARASVERALQKFSDDRFPSAGDMASAIAAARADAILSGRDTVESQTRLSANTEPKTQSLYNGSERRD